MDRNIIKTNNDMEYDIMSENLRFTMNMTNTNNLIIAHIFSHNGDTFFKTGKLLKTN